MCSSTWETHIPSDMCSPTWETRIPSDMCSPTWETHIPCDMCSPTWETRIPSDMCSPTWERHIPSDMCSPTWETHIPSDMICVPPARKHIFLEMCVPLPGKDSHFFYLQVCLNLFFLSGISYLSADLLMLWEIFSLRDCKFSFSVSHSWSNHFICDLHLILLPLTFHPACLHVSVKVSLSNSDAVSMLSCLTAAANLDWTVYINSDMTTPTGPARKHMPATFCYSPAT